MLFYSKYGTMLVKQINKIKKVIKLQDKPIYISDTLHNTIQLSILEKKIISTQLFNRLHNISQNSTAYLTFPTNRTKRFEHSIGTMKICGEMFYYSINNISSGVLDSFIEDLKQNIKKEFIEGDMDKYRISMEDKDLDNLEEYQEYDVDSCFYNSAVPKCIDKKKVFLYLVVFQAIRIAALLHDIGHPPFSHITENAIKQALDNVSKEKEFKVGIRKELFLNIMKQYTKEDTINKKGESFQLHEQLGKKMTERLLENIIKEDKPQSFCSMYFNILTTQMAIYILNEKNPFFKQIHSIIDGAIDGDRLDYVSRDVINSGFESGRIEYSRLISSMVLCKYKEEYTFVADIKVLNTVEDFFFRRWKLYKNIVYHHRVIKTDHLLQNSIYQMIMEYLNDSEEEIEQDKKDFRLPNDISGLWKPLTLTGSNRKYFDALIQWDDGWLLSILKQYYFSVGYQKEASFIYELEELLSNKKQFYSMIKDANDFNRLDKVIIENIEVDFEKVKNFGKDLDDNYTKLINKIEQKCKAKENFKSGYFLFDVKLLIEIFFKDNYNFKDLISEMVKDFISKEFDNVKEYFIEFKVPNYGLSKTPYILNGKDVLLLSSVSNIGEILEYDGRMFPVFHLYIRKKEEKIKYEDFINRLGKAIAKELNRFFASIS